MWQWQTFTLIKIGHWFRKTCRTLTLSLSISSAGFNVLQRCLASCPGPTPLTLWPVSSIWIGGRIWGPVMGAVQTARLKHSTSPRLTLLIYTSSGPWLSWLSCIHLDHLSIAWQTFSHTFLLRCSYSSFFLRSVCQIRCGAMDPGWQLWNLWFFGPHTLHPKLEILWMSSVTIPRMVENIHQRLVMMATTGIRTAKIWMETSAATTSVTSVAGAAGISGISWVSFLLVRKLSYVTTYYYTYPLSTIISFLTLFVYAGLFVHFVRRTAVPPTVNSNLALNALVGPWLHRLNLRQKICCKNGCFTLLVWSGLNASRSVAMASRWNLAWIRWIESEVELRWKHLRDSLSISEVWDILGLWRLWREGWRAGGLLFFQSDATVTRFTEKAATMEISSPGMAATSFARRVATAYAVCHDSWLMT